MTAIAEKAEPRWKRVKTPLGTVKCRRLVEAEIPERLSRKKNRNKGQRRQRASYPELTTRREQGKRSDGALVILGGCVSKRTAFNRYFRPPVDTKKAERLAAVRAHEEKIAGRTGR